MPRVFKLRPDADLHPELCRTDGCAGTPHIRGVCDGCRATARGVGAYEAIAGPNRRGQKRATIAVAKPPAGKAPLSEAEIATEIGNAEKRELTLLRRLDADHRATILKLETERIALVRESNDLRDFFAPCADKLQVLVTVLNLDPAGDLTIQARDIAAWLTAAIDATNAFGGTTPADLRDAVADAVADTRLDTVKGPQARLAAYERKVMELVDEVGRLDQAHWRTIHDDAVAVASAHQHPPAANQPASQVFDLYQLGHVHRGPLRGYIDGAGLFRATDGAVYGAIFSAVPVTRPVLGEPTAGDAVWVRTSIAEVTPGGIYLDDGGRMPHGAWQPHRVRPAKAVSAAASFSASALGDAPSDDDDIPF